MSDADDPDRPSGRLILVLAVTALPVSMGLLWIGIMRLDGLPAFLVMVLAYTIVLAGSAGPTLVRGFRARRRQRSRTSQVGEGDA